MAAEKTKSSRRSFTMLSKIRAAFRASMKSAKNSANASRVSLMAARIPMKLPARKGNGAKENALISKR
jgi:hypothetical protein